RGTGGSGAAARSTRAARVRIPELARLFIVRRRRARRDRAWRHLYAAAREWRGGGRDGLLALRRHAAGRGRARGAAATVRAAWHARGDERSDARRRLGHGGRA